LLPPFLIRPSAALGLIHLSTHLYPFLPRSVCASNVMTGVVISSDTSVMNHPVSRIGATLQEILSQSLPWYHQVRHNNSNIIKEKKTKKKEGTNKRISNTNVLTQNYVLNDSSSSCALHQPSQKETQLCVHYQHRLQQIRTWSQKVLCLTSKQII
jgi:hypothetical protein